MGFAVEKNETQMVEEGSSIITTTTATATATWCSLLPILRSLLSVKEEVVMKICRVLLKYADHFIRMAMIISLFSQFSFPEGAYGVELIKESKEQEVAGLSLSTFIDRGTGKRICSYYDTEYTRIQVVLSFLKLIHGTL